MPPWTKATGWREAGSLSKMPRRREKTMFKNCKTAINHLYCVVGCFLVLVYAHAASAQESLPSVKPLQNPNSGGNLTGFFTAKTPYEFWLSCLIGVFGLVIIGALILAVRRVDNARPEDFARPIIIVTVIIGT